MMLDVLGDAVDAEGALVHDHTRVQAAHRCPAACARPPARTRRAAHKTLTGSLVRSGWFATEGLEINVG